LLKVSPDKVATTNYVNPVVALWMGWMFNDEVLSKQSLLAAGILLIGVFLIITKLKK
jgi:drug/metabolite transporter (DMT)-like permease